MKIKSYVVKAEDGSLLKGTKHYWMGHNFLTQENADRGADMGDIFFASNPKTAKATLTRRIREYEYQGVARMLEGSENNQLDWKRLNNAQVVQVEIEI